MYQITVKLPVLYFVVLFCLKSLFYFEVSVVYCLSIFKVQAQITVRNVSGEWTELEKLERLRMMKPPWLRQQITMCLVNTELNVQIGDDLMGIVS